MKPEEMTNENADKLRKSGMERRLWDKPRERRSKAESAWEEIYSAVSDHQNGELTVPGGYIAVSEKYIRIFEEYEKLIDEADVLRKENEELRAQAQKGGQP